MKLFGVLFWIDTDRGDQDLIKTCTKYSIIGLLLKKKSIVVAIPALALLR